MDSPLRVLESRSMRQIKQRRESWFRSQLRETYQPFVHVGDQEIAAHVIGQIHLDLTWELG